MSKELAKTYDPEKGLKTDFIRNGKTMDISMHRLTAAEKPFTIVMPPPNITGQLHMGHALDNTMQDILIRYKRMQGYECIMAAGNRPCSHCNRG